jgi:hypothetical protein
MKVMPPTHFTTHSILASFENGCWGSPHCAAQAAIVAIPGGVGLPDFCAAQRREAGRCGRHFRRVRFFSLKHCFVGFFLQWSISVRVSRKLRGSAQESLCLPGECKDKQVSPVAFVA